MILCSALCQEKFCTLSHSSVCSTIRQSSCVQDMWPGGQYGTGEWCVSGFSGGRFGVLLCFSHACDVQARFMSGGGGRKGFLGEFLDNLKQELSKNKEMKENIKKFREEAKKLEESEALKQARRKYVRMGVFMLHIN